MRRESKSVIFSFTMFPADTPRAMGLLSKEQRNKAFVKQNLLTKFTRDCLRAHAQSIVMHFVAKNLLVK